jgi:thiamine-phosphate pyrophosphorylase
MKPLARCRLYTFIDTGYLRGRSPAEVARLLCQGGSDLIQLRAKDLPAEKIQSLAETILPVLAGFGVGLVINDFPAVARATGAPLCHLGQEDFFDRGYSGKSEILPAGSPVLLGLSTHSPLQAERAIAAGADYLAIGPVFPTGTKPTAPPVTLEYVKWAAVHVSIPWFAIGGIQLENLESVLQAGARRICVVSAILEAPDPAEACHQLKERLLSVPL